MKIQYAFMSCDDNPFYLDFWNVIYPVWIKKFNITPVLIHIGDKHVYREPDNVVVNINSIPDIPIALQAQWARFYFTSIYSESVCIISDIDMLPLSNFYFQEQIKNFSNDDYVHLNPCIGYQHIPACYHVAKGKLFKEVLKLKDSWEDDVRRLYNEYYETYTWFSDERYSHDMITNYPNKEIFKFLNRDGNVDGHRINRPILIWDIDLMRQNYYYDAHLPRPYSENKIEIDKLIGNINYE
jgi:hypothetical protein